MDGDNGLAIDAYFGRAFRRVSRSMEFTWPRLPVITTCSEQTVWSWIAMAGLTC